MPALSAAKPSSFSEHIIPNDSTPRTLACLISKPGNTAPTKAHGALIPTRAFLAPQTICSGSAAPIFTLSSCNRSASGCFSALIISAITTLVNSAPTPSRPSTSKPAIVNKWLNASVSIAGLVYSRNHCSENCIFIAQTAARSANRY